MCTVFVKGPNERWYSKCAKSDHRKPDLPEAVHQILE
jgi:hypothetical protein